MREIKNNPQVYTTQKGKEEIKTNPQVYTTQKGKKEIKNDSQVYTTQEGKEEIKGRSNIITIEPLTLYTLTLVFIFSTLISLHFLWQWQGEFCLTIRSFLNLWLFLFFSQPLHLIQGWYFKEKLEASHS